MKNFLLNLSFKKVAILPALGLIFAAILVLGIAPRKINVAKSENCANAPTVATLNPFPYSYGTSAGFDCTDFAPLVVKNLTQGGSYPTSLQDHADGVNAQAGDELYVRIYIHNGAKQGLDTLVTTARNVNAYITVDGTAEPEHVVGVTLSGQRYELVFNSQFDEYGNPIDSQPNLIPLNNVLGSMSIHTGPQDRLEVVPGSGELFDYLGNSVGTVPVGSEAFNVSLGDLNACFEFAKFIRFKIKVVGPAIVPTPTPTPTPIIVEASGSIEAGIGSSISGQCLYNGTVFWDSYGASFVDVTVRDPETGAENLFSHDLDNTGSETPWLEPNRNYRFTLWNTSSGQRQHLAETWLAVPNLNCAPDPEPTPTPVPLDFTLKVFKAGQETTQFCVGEMPEYRIDGNSSAADKSILWSSFKNNVATSEIDADYGFSTNESGDWQAFGTIWQPDYIGSWRKEAKINGLRKSVSFSVTDCSPEVVAVTCTISPNPVNVNSPVTVTASGGNGVYSFSAPGLMYGILTGNTLVNGKYQTSGVKTVTVESGNQSGTCSVTVNQPAASLVCPAGAVSLNPATIKVSEQATALAPSGWSGGSFISSQTSKVTVNSSALNGISIGTSSISGLNWTAPNGAVNCPLSPATITVTQTLPQLTCNTITGMVNTNQNASFQASGGSGSYTWQANGGSPASGSGVNFSTAYASSGSKTVSVTSGTQTVNCPVVTVNQPIESDVSCELLTSGIVNINENVSVRANGGNNIYAFNAASGNPSSQSASSNKNFTAQFAASGSKIITVISNGKTASCPVVTVIQPQSALVCSTLSSSVNQGSPAYFTASGASGNYSWTASGGSPTTGNGANFSTVYNAAGNKTVTVQSGNQSALCQVNVTAQPEVCVKNTNINFERGAIISAGVNTYKTTISYSWNGSNPMKVTYVDPADGQEKTFVSAAINGGSQEFASIEPNKNYIFKIYDTSTCGGVLATLIVRKDVDNTCVSNSNFALNVGTPVKQGEVYSVNVTWSSTGSHQIKISQNSTGNIITTGPNSGQIGVNNLSAGSSHTFYMTDAACSSLLTATTVNIPNPTLPPTGGGNINSCVNFSCNIINNNTNTNNYYYYTYGNPQPIPPNEYRQLAIEKLVRNTSQSAGFQNTVNANINDVVEFQITVRNVGNQPVNNVRINDIMPNGLSFISGSFNSNDYYIGTLYVNDSRTVSFQARVNLGSNTSIQNVARASGDLVDQKQDDAWVFVQGVVQGGAVNLSYQKHAVNETKNADATSVNASSEDFVLYTLKVTNTGNLPANNFVITDDLSQVLPYADLVDNGGGILSGSVINYPGITVPANGSVSKSFKVRVKFNLQRNLSYNMSNTYGNTVLVKINTPQVLGAFVAPKTGGPSIAYASIFGGILASGLGIFINRKKIWKFVLN